MAYYITVFKLFLFHFIVNHPYYVISIYDLRNISKYLLILMKTFGSLDLPLPFGISDFLEEDQKEDFWASLFEWTIINVITVLWSSCLILSLPLLLNICIFNSNKHFRYRNYKSKFFIIRHLKILIT